MMYTRMTFAPVKQSRKVKTYCTSCNRGLVRMLSTTYYRNGLHNEAETHRKNDKKLDAQAKEMSKKGTVCKRCGGCP